MIPRQILLRTVYRAPSANLLIRSNRRSYASSSDPSQSSSRVPLIIGIALAAGVGAYFTLLPKEKQDQAKEAVHNAKEQAKDKLNTKGSEAHKKLEELDKSRRPKDNVDKDSEAGHQKASETNEHKVRHGVFSGKDFDNHDCKHTNDPSKDFEVIEKNK